jgi:hypothetical protein
MTDDGTQAGADPPTGADEEQPVAEFSEDPAPTDPAGFSPITAPIYQPPMLPFQPPPPMAALPVPVRRRRYDFTPILIALAAVLVLGAGFAVTVLAESGRQKPVAQATPTTSLSTASVAPSPSTQVMHDGAPLPLAVSTPVADPLEITQATAMNAVLQQSAGTFTQVNAAINQVAQCVDVDGATAVLANAEQSRSDQAGQAQALEVSALPGGPELQGLLVQSLQASGASDAEYAKWASESDIGADGTPTCAPGAPPAPSSQDEQAGTLKGQFSALWKPIASRLGISTPGDY